MCKLEKVKAFTNEPYKPAISHYQIIQLSHLLIFKRHDPFQQNSTGRDSIL